MVNNELNMDVITSQIENIKKRTLDGKNNCEFTIKTPINGLVLKYEGLYMISSTYEESAACRVSIVCQKETSVIYSDEPFSKKNNLDELFISLV